ncbi:MAG: ECF transporter S component [Oscillospiraceae bacterium]|jgi:uncharacterized membrane protein|nr:ECF transporter S component [Oscillospiraceae bacterium]
MKLTTREITTAAVAAALIFAVTAIVRVPMPVPGGEGYFNLGDAAIFLCAFLIGGWRAALAAAIGSSISDLALGFPVYILPTFIIKGLMGLTAAKLCYGKGFVRFLLACVTGALIMTLGYTAFEFFVFSPATATVSLPGNALQGVAAVICSASLYVPVTRLKLLLPTIEKRV